MIMGTIFLSVSALLGIFVMSTSTIDPHEKGKLLRHGGHGEHGEREHLSPATMKKRNKKKNRHLHGHKGEAGVHEHGDDGRHHHHHHHHHKKGNTFPDMKEIVEENRERSLHDDHPHHDDILRANRKEDESGGDDDDAHKIAEELREQERPQEQEGQEEELSVEELFQMAIEEEEMDVQEKNQEEKKPPENAPGAGEIGEEELLAMIREEEEEEEQEEAERNAEVNGAQLSSEWKPPGGDRFTDYRDGSNVYSYSGNDDHLLQLARSRREKIRDAMKHAWGGYKTHAFGNDEVKPQSHGKANPWGGIGTTLVDSLDTLWLMGMKDEFWEARDWVRDHLDHSHVGTVSVFETTIRSLGGLLSAYDWSGDEAFLDKALDLGTRLGRAFDTRSGIPSPRINLGNGNPGHVRATNTNIAEAGTLQIEFRYLARAAHQPELARKAEKVFELLKPLQSQNGGLFPWGITATPSFYKSEITFGAMGDSFYEYMLKVWLQGGQKEDMYREMYDKAMEGLHKNLIQKTNDGLTYIVVKDGSRFKHKMDHLACFMAGTLALGAYTDPTGLESERAQRDLTTGKALAYTCYQMYARTKTGIGPEVASFYGGNMGIEVGSYILRPEVVESFFILNQLTGDPTYREWGWEAFQAIERFCKTDIAYGGLRDVNNDKGQPEDKMESFFLAETMKYLFLLQDPDTEIDILNKHVFNTEAHPTRIFPLFDEEMKETSAQ